MRCGTRMPSSRRIQDENSHLDCQARRPGWGARVLAVPTSRLAMVTVRPITISVRLLRFSTRAMARPVSTPIPRDNGSSPAGAWSGSTPRMAASKSTAACNAGAARALVAASTARLALRPQVGAPFQTAMMASPGRLLSRPMALDDAWRWRRRHAIRRQPLPAVYFRSRQRSCGCRRTVPIPLLGAGPDGARRWLQCKRRSHGRRQVAWKDGYRAGRDRCGSWRAPGCQWQNRPEL